MIGDNVLSENRKRHGIQSYPSVTVDYAHHLTYAQYDDGNGIF